MSIKLNPNIDNSGYLNYEVNLNLMSDVRENRPKWNDINNYSTK